MRVMPRTRTGAWELWPCARGAFPGVGRFSDSLHDSFGPLLNGIRVAAGATDAEW